MIRSSRRPVVVAQAEHARLAATIALCWGAGPFDRPPVPFDAFVRGVALHDRGYGEHDADGLGEVPRARWLAIQRAGFAAQDPDPVVDLVVALHVRRLVAWGTSEADRATVAEMDAALPARHAAAGVSAAAAAAADRICDLCDRVALLVCLEREASGSVDVPGGAVAWATDGAGGATLAPWPLDVPVLRGLLVAHAADGYPERRAPVLLPFTVAPG